METNFNFKSQICTTREQSERLIALGLKKETADMSILYVTHDLSGKEIEPPLLAEYLCEPMFCEERQTVLFSRQKFIPAWSLHRLIEMMPQYLYITRDKEEFFLDINNDGVMYDGVAMKLALVEFVECGNLYDNIIGCIAYLIKEGYFNKEYLV